MEQGTVRCPKCEHQFEISDALTGQIREHLRAELQQDNFSREAELKKKRDKLDKDKEELEQARDALNEEVEKQLSKKLKSAEAKATKRVKDEYAAQIRDLMQELNEKKTAIGDFRERELELLKGQRELEEAREQAELDFKRKLAQERKKLRADIETKFAEDHRLKDLEKENLISGLKKDLDEMKRKAEQGSMETQGEVLEQDFEAQLRHFFPYDEISPVPKGISGADLIQTVRSKFGAECGIMVWETKNTNAWGTKWIAKLKDDAIATRAAISILVSVALPDDIKRFGFKDGVWVSDPLSAIPLAMALRQQLLAAEHERQLSEGKSEKMEMLYEYLAGTEFKQKIEGIVEAFIAMQEQINRERRTMEKQWKEREKQIQRVMKNTTGLYGDMQGIIGGQLPKIQMLEMEASEIKELPAKSDS